MEKVKISVGGTVVKNPPTSAGDLGDKGSTLGSGRPPEVKNGNLPVFLPGKFHEQRRLAAHNP